MNAPLRAGDVVAGKYRIDAVLGEGGMGVVVSAHHLHLDEMVAIKLLLPKALEVPEVVARFAREARAAAKIKSEHVARVIDVGTLDTGAPFMVMEFLKGQDLGKMLRENGPFPVSVAAHHVIEACEALAEAHALEIVHRDIKPANLFLARMPGGETIIKVLDFGISKLAEQASDLSLTKTQSMLGTPLYMSVEQMTASKETDSRADIWSLGVVLYELVTGRVPFTGENAHAVLAAMLQTTPLMPSEIRPEVPAAFDAIVKRCLTVDAKKRYANVAELARALTQFSPGEERVERISRVLGITSTEPATPAATTAANETKPESKSESETTARLPAQSAQAPAPSALNPTTLGSPPPSAVPSLRAQLEPTAPPPTLLQTQGSWDAPLPVSRSHVWAPVAGGIVLIAAIGGIFAVTTRSSTPSVGIVMTAQPEASSAAAVPSSRLLPIEAPPPPAPPPPAEAPPPARVLHPTAPAVAPPPPRPSAATQKSATPPAPPDPAPPPPPAPRRSDNPLDMRPK